MVPDKTERFSIGSAYGSSQRSITEQGYWPWKMIWKFKMTFKVACLTWLLAKQAALTQDSLMKRGLQFCSRCSFCECEAETVKLLSTL